MKTYDYYINAATKQRVSEDGHAQSDPIVWYRGDVFLARFHFLDVTAPGQDGGYVPHALPAGSTYFFSGKRLPGNDPFLFWSDHDKFSVDVGGGILSVIVDLRGDGLNNILVSSQPNVNVLGEIEETDDEGWPDTTQFSVRILGDVRRGNEGITEDTAPSYVTRGEAYAAFLNVVGTHIIECQDDQLTYDIPIEAEPTQVIGSVRRPSGGDVHVTWNWSVEDGGDTLRITLSAYPPEGTKVYITIIAGEVIEDEESS